MIDNLWICYLSSFVFYIIIYLFLLIFLLIYVFEVKFIFENKFFLKKSFIFYSNIKLSCLFLKF